MNAAEPIIPDIPTRTLERRGRCLQHLSPSTTSSPSGRAASKHELRAGTTTRARKGTYTSIPMLIAEELDVNLKQVHLEHAPPNEKLYANPMFCAPGERQGRPGTRNGISRGHGRRHAVGDTSLVRAEHAAMGDVFTQGH